MLFSILLWYTIVTAGGGFIAGALLPMWGPFPAHGRLGLGIMGAAMGPIAVPLLVGSALVSLGEALCGR